MAKFLLLNHARVDWQDELGRTALFFAVKNDNIKLIKLLLLHKANPGIKSTIQELIVVNKPTPVQKTQIPNSKKISCNVVSFTSLY
jgi:ankyrin repeat protein